MRLAKKHEKSDTRIELLEEEIRELVREKQEGYSSKRKREAKHSNKNYIVNSSDEE